MKAGLVTEADIDRALTRLYTALFRLGMFDPQTRVPYAQIPITENHSSAGGTRRRRRRDLRDRRSMNT